LACIGAHKSAILVKALKVANALDGAIVFALGLVILDSDPLTFWEFSYATHKHHLSSPSVCNLASVTNLEAAGLLGSHDRLPCLLATQFKRLQKPTFKPYCDEFVRFPPKEKKKKVDLKK
jgi:hypothetical protein